MKGDEKMPSREIVERIRSEYPAGTRVELVKMDDPQAPPVGTRGTVRGVDDTGSLLMKWDSGCGLNVVYGEDIVRKGEGCNLPSASDVFKMSSAKEAYDIISKAAALEMYYEERCN